MGGPFLCGRPINTSQAPGPGPGASFSNASSGKLVRANLAHRHCHAAQVERRFKANLPSAHFHDNAVCILEACGGTPARNRDAGADGRICSDDILGPPQVMSAADHIGARRADGTEAEPADAQRIRPTTKNQCTCPTTGADDKAGPGNTKTDRPGL